MVERDQDARQADDPDAGKQQKALVGALVLVVVVAGCGPVFDLGVVGHSVLQTLIRARK